MAGRFIPPPLLLLLLLWLALPACDDRPIRDPFSSNPGAPQFKLGDAAKYKPHGLYFDYVDPHHVLLVSRPASRGTMLVALDFRCTYDQNPLEYNDLTDRLHCNRCDSRWSTDGLIQSGSVATESLPRYRMRLTGTRVSDQREVVVDMSRQFHQKITKQFGSKQIVVREWSATDSMYHFENDPRINPLEGKVEVK